MIYISAKTLKADVEKRIEDNKAKIAKAETKLADDFMSALSWGNAESKFKAMFLNRQLEKLLGYIDNEDDTKKLTLAEWVPYNIEYNTKSLFENQRIVVGGSYWGRMCTLMQNESIVWWIEYLEEVQKYFEREQPIK